MSYRRKLSIVILLAFAVGWACARVFGQVPEGTAIAKPIDAAAWALRDIHTISPERRHAIRYVWLPPWINSREGAQVNSFATNTAVSRATAIVIPRLPAKGWIVRWDLSALGGSVKGFEDLLNVWEKFAQTEPYFHALIVRNGKTLIGSAYHVGDTHRQLAAQSGTAVPIVRADWFLTKSMTTLGGGLYYDFQGFERNPAKGTAEEAWLRLFGADEKLAEQVNGDQRAALFFSQVTGKPRRVDFFRGVAGRSNSGLITITHDIGDGDTAANQHPIRNLLVLKDTAREAIAERQNGLHSFALFNAKGELQDSAPDNIVADHQIPPPHTRRLEACISCIRCHGPNEGYQPVANDVQSILRAKNLDVFGDLTKGADDAVAVLDRLAGLYAGNLDKPLRRARDDYQEAVAKATSGLDASKAAALTSQQFAAYRYELVSPRQAVSELGIRLGEKADAVKALQWLVPPLPADERGVSPEDPIIGSLKAGLSVNRTDWEQVYADCATRAVPRLREFLNPRQF